MPGKGKPFTSDTAREAGKKSKRLPLNRAWQDKLEKLKEGGDGTILDDIFQTLTIEAAAGNIQAVKELLDRTYGKAVQKQEISGKDGGAIETSNVILDKKDIVKARKQMIKEDDV